MPRSHRTAPRPSTLALAALLAFAAGQASAAGDHAGGHGHDDGHGHAADIGKPGEPAQVSRTVEVVMTDHDYNRDTITVTQGETIRFVVRNEGEFVHEFNIGTATTHTAHQDEMMEMMEEGVLEADRINRTMMRNAGSNGHGEAMAHDDPNSVLLEPGESAEIVWTFPTEPGLEFACNIPGHYQGGMKGEFRIRDGA